MESREELKSELEQLEDMIGMVIERWERAVDVQDKIEATDDEFVTKWKALNEGIDRLERQRELFMDNHAEIKKRMLKIEGSNF